MCVCVREREREREKLQEHLSRNDMKPIKKKRGLLGIIFHVREKTKSLGEAGWKEVRLD